MSIRPHGEFGSGAANGITAQVISAGMNDSAGASMKSGLFAAPGSVSSFMKFLTPSASRLAPSRMHDAVGPVPILNPRRDLALGQRQHRHAHHIHGEHDQHLDDRAMRAPTGMNPVHELRRARPAIVHSAHVAAHARDHAEPRRPQTVVASNRRTPCATPASAANTSAASQYSAFVPIGVSRSLSTTTRAARAPGAGLGLEIALHAAAQIRERAFFFGHVGRSAAPAAARDAHAGSVVPITTIAPARQRR